MMKRRLYARSANGRLSYVYGSSQIPKLAQKLKGQTVPDQVYPMQLGILCAYKSEWLADWTP